MRVPLTLAVLVLASGCAGAARDGGAGRVEITIAASAVGEEGQLLARQLAGFERANPGIRVRLRRTPDDATQRHQLFVQWLNAHAGDPDVLQLDVVWTPEFAAAGWILPLDRFAADTASFLPAVLAANRWRDSLYALPWFVDVGLLYWRTDLMDGPPATMAELERRARAASGAPGQPPYGIVWQGARYEGLITVFLEYLGATGGRILDDGGAVVVDGPAAVRALELMRGQVAPGGIAPRDVLGWHEEEARFAFQNGEAVFMRNWPYAYTLMADTGASRVAGRYAVTAMPASDGGSPAAALGGAQLAINAYSGRPAAAWRLVEYLTGAERMLERAATLGQFPTRTALYDDPRLARALPVPLDQVRAAVRAATARPATPVWTELSEILQVHVHRALTGQSSPEAALRAAADGMQAVLERTGVRDLAHALATRATGPAR